MVLVHYRSQYYRYIMCNDMLTCYIINLNHFATMVFSVRTMNDEMSLYLNVVSLCHANHGSKNVQIYNVAC